MIAQQQTMTEPSGVVGLHNFKNTCYFNAIVQILIHTPALQSHFLHPSVPDPPTEEELKQVFSSIKILKQHLEIKKLKNEEKRRGNMKEADINDDQQNCINKIKIQPLNEKNVRIKEKIGNDLKYNDDNGIQSLFKNIKPNTNIYNEGPVTHNLREIFCQFWINPPDIIEQKNEKDQKQKPIFFPTDLFKSINNIDKSFTYSTQQGLYCTILFNYILFNSYLHFLLYQYIHSDSLDLFLCMIDNISVEEHRRLENITIFRIAQDIIRINRKKINRIMNEIKQYHEDGYINQIIQNEINQNQINQTKILSLKQPTPKQLTLTPSPPGLQHPQLLNNNNTNSININNSNSNNMMQQSPAMTQTPVTVVTSISYPSQSTLSQSISSQSNSLPSSLQSLMPKQQSLSPNQLQSNQVPNAISPSISTQSVSLSNYESKTLNDNKQCQQHYQTLYEQLGKEVLSILKFIHYEQQRMEEIRMDIPLERKRLNERIKQKKHQIELKKGRNKLEGQGSQLNLLKAQSQQNNQINQNDKLIAKYSYSTEYEQEEEEEQDLQLMYYSRMSKYQICDDDEFDEDERFNDIVSLYSFMKGIKKWRKKSNQLYQIQPQCQEGQQNKDNEQQDVLSSILHYLKKQSTTIPQFLKLQQETGVNNMTPLIQSPYPYPSPTPTPHNTNNNQTNEAIQRKNIYSPLIQNDTELQLQQLLQENIIDDTFSGEMISLRRCCICGDIVKTREKMMHLSLPLQVTSSHSEQNINQRHSVTFGTSNEGGWDENAISLHGSNYKSKDTKYNQKYNNQLQLGKFSDDADSLDDSTITSDKINSQQMNQSQQQFQQQPKYLTTNDVFNKALQLLKCDNIEQLAELESENKKIEQTIISPVIIPNNQISSKETINIINSFIL